MDTYISCIVQKFQLNQYPVFIRNSKCSFGSFFIKLLFQKGRGILHILNDEESALASFNELSSLIKDRVVFFPALYVFNGQKHKYYEYNLQLRTSVLKHLMTVSEPLIIVSYLDALTETVPSKDVFSDNKFTLSRGEKISYGFLLDFLNEYGFLKTEFVYFPGQYAVRGSIIDVFSYANEYPVRIEFKGDVVERLSEFHPSTQMSFRTINEFTIVSKLERDSSVECFLYEYLSEEYVYVFKDASYFVDSDVHKVFKEKFYDCIRSKNIIYYGLLPSHNVSDAIDFNISPQPLFGKNYEALSLYLFEAYRLGFKNYFVSNNKNQYKRLVLLIDDSLSKNNIRVDNVSDIIDYFYGEINEGFIDNDCRFAFYTEHQVFQKYHPVKRKDKAEEANATLTIKSLIELKPGDFVVHTDHGIGRFAGLHTIDVNGKKQEVIKLLYKNNDVLFVNIHNLYRLSRFSGKDGHEPKVDQLGSQRWQAVKQKIKSSVKQLAYDLIKLYAERKTAEGFSFSKDTYLQYELEASFPFEDTPDQIKVMREVKRDMEKPYPMDRLVCGDVGFGKTEIAVRAAFKAVTDGKQVAVLVPTTILALQHYNTFSERMKNFPVKINYLNRFKSHKEQKQIIEDIKQGKIDIIIGTHKLLSKDIVFKDLGLLIIDEEHKFGVADKDKIKLLKKNIDTLTLTATPIPRTLQLSLIGARDLSVIQTPPPNRFPVKTELYAFSDEIIQNAIQYEIERGGQVFFVHNKVQDIFELADKIRSLIPYIKVSVAHGQMKSVELEDALMNFINGDSQLLLSTNIIESGIDISNANTIIINNAQNFGLSDLHQLRGRVGRSNRQAFCYLLVPSLHILTDDAKKRLNAIVEFSDLGSGFQVAMKDLDIRGAGNILGGEQSGFINEVGIDTYMKILNETIAELKHSDDVSLQESAAAFSHQLMIDCVLDTDLPLFIPPEYISSSAERLNLYRQLNSCTTYAQLDEFRDMLKDRFGNLPLETYALIESVKLRWKAAKLGFEKLILKGNKMIAVFISNPNHVYYKTSVFEKIMQFISTQKSFCTVKEQNNKLMLVFENISDISKAYNYIQALTDHALHLQSSIQ